jgi:hypothetical protein
MDQKITSRPEGGGSFRIGGDDDKDAGELTVVEQATAMPDALRGVPITDSAHPDNPDNPDNKDHAPPPLPAGAGNHFDDQ